MKYRDRDISKNIEDRHSRDINWDRLVSPSPISPTKQTFQKKLDTNTNYSFQKRK